MVMWKDYSISYIKNNRSSSISVIAATLISALLLSLLCGLFYNLWNYEIERIELEEGDWQSRIASRMRLLTKKNPQIKERSLTFIFIP